MCQDHGVQYKSPVTLKVLTNVAHSDACADHCHASGPCRYWEFTAQSKSCHLITSFGSVTFIGGSNVISGVSPCPKGSELCKILMYFKNNDHTECVKLIE